MVTAMITTAALALVPAPAFSMGLQESEPLPFDPEIRTGVLENGLSYFVREHAEPADRASLRLVVNAGSVLEDDDQLGLAHFLEHMAFNGTEDFAEQEIVDYLESIGMQFGPDVNAYTSFDETVYMVEVPTNDAEAFDRAFTILQQWASALTLDPDEIDKERGVIVEEWRVGRGASARVSDALVPVLFAGSLYAERLPIGDMDIIETFDRESLVRYFEDWYRPELMAVIAVGDFDSSEAIAKIEDYFGGLENPSDPRPRPTYSIPDHIGSRYVVVADPELTYSQVAIYNKTDLVEPTDREGYRELVLQNLYLTMINTRLEEIAQEGGTPFLAAATGSAGLVRTKGVNYATAVVYPSDIGPGLERLLAEVRQVEQSGFGVAEFERGKQRVLRQIENLYLERDNVPSSSLAAEYTRHFLENEPVPGIPAEYELFNEFVPEITLAELNTLAGSILSADNRVVAVATVESADHDPPTVDALATVVEGIDETAADPDSEAPESDEQTEEDKEMAGEFLPNPPEPGEYRVGRTWDDLEVTELVLSNGIRVYVRPTDFAADEVRLSAFSPGGASLIPLDYYVEGILATTIVSESGIGTLSAVELRRRLSGNLVQVSPYIDTNFEGFSASASVADMELMFELITAYATAVRSDPEAADRYVERIAAFLANREGDPNTVFSDRLTELLTGNHPRAEPLDLELLSAFNYDNALEVYQDRFADLDDLTVVVVGNVEVEAVGRLSADYLAGLPSLPETETWTDRGIDYPDEPIVETVRAGIEPQSTVALVYHGDVEWAREESHRLTSLADYLRIRLREVLREDEGGTYGVGVGAQMSRIPSGRYLFQVTFSTDPARVRDLTDQVYAEIEAVAAGDVAAEDVQKVVETQLRNYETALEENAFWVSNLVNLLRNDRDLGDILNFAALPQSLEPKDISRTAATYLQRDGLIELIRYPVEQ